MNKMLLPFVFVLFYVDRIINSINPLTNQFRFAFWINDIQEQNKSILRVVCLGLIMFICYLFV